MAQVSQYAKDILSALVYLRNMHIVHADLKPANIMVCGKHVKLVDFGLSFECHPNNHGCTNTAGSPVYSAPELITHTPYNPYIAAAWSFGVVLYEMLYRSNPYESKIREIEKQNLSFPEMLVKLVHHMKTSNVVFPDNERKKMWNISEKYSPVPESVKDTISKCMTLDTTKRYTLDSLLQCDLIKNTSF